MAAELLADADFPGMERHPFALCGVSLAVFPGDPITGHFPGSEKCPECDELEQPSQPSSSRRKRA